MARDHASAAAVGALLALALATCFCGPGGAMAQDACFFDEATDLIAGQTINVGDVNVCNDATTLTVTYELTSPWCLLATHLHVATSEDDIPQGVAIRGRGSSTMATTMTPVSIRRRSRSTWRTSARTG